MLTHSLLINILIGIGITTFACIVVLLKWRMKYWSRRGVYSLTTNVFFGNSKALVFKQEGLGQAFAKYYMHFKEKRKSYGGYFFFFRPVLLPVDLDVIKNIMVTDFDYFTDRVFYNNKNDVLSTHLVAAKGLMWRQLRKALSPAFTPAKNKLMLKPISKCVVNLLSQLHPQVVEKQPVEMKGLLSRLIMDIIGECAYGIESKSLEKKESDFLKQCRKFFNPSARDNLLRLFVVLYPELLNIFGLKFTDKDTTDYFISLVKKVIEFNKLDNTISNNFINIMLQIQKEQQHNDKDLVFTNEIIAAQCYFFLIAGYEAVSSTITMCLLELALYKDIQNKVRDEVENVLNVEGELTYENVINMSYLDQCIKETLRKYPPTPIAFRECTKTYKLPRSDLTIEKGVAVFVSISGIHRDPDYYPDPEVFDPNRFSKENESKRNPYAYIPFGVGPRNCIAYRFGLLQAKYVIATLLRKYSFSVNRRTEIPVKMDTTSIVERPLNGVWFDVQEA